jgi:hypothetical protein
MTDMLTGTMMEELANIITCVMGDARQRRTIYEADQDFEAGPDTVQAFSLKCLLSACASN